MIDTKSSWEQSKLRSQYHFDNHVMDPRWDTIEELGHIVPAWQTELDEIIAESRPATWATRGYKGQGIEAPPEELATEEYDLERTGYHRDLAITHLNWNLPPVLQQVSDLFALDDCMNRIHVQQPGEVWNLHLDKLQKWSPDAPDQVMRIMIHLTDWQPGHFWSYGNYTHSGWYAGDVTTFDWQHVPHSTANAGHSARVTLQITGVRTAKTGEFLTTLKRSLGYQLCKNNS
jgi:hypothetical protein